MPNHVANEVIFRNVDPAMQDKILSIACDQKGEIDFSILLPIPLNCWMGGVSKRHQDTFPDNALDWCRKNWSTKWNAYGDRTVERTDNSLTFRFDSTWGPPMGWIVALYNKLQIAFEYHWLSEGESRGHSGFFAGPSENYDFDEWKESECGDEMQKHLHMLRWGCESFPENEEIEAEQ